MKVNFDYPRPGSAEIMALARHSSATVHEALPAPGVFHTAIKPIVRGMKVCGPALTVECPKGDNLMIHVAMAGAQPGDLLVVDHEASMEDGPFGEVMSTSCRARGIAGLVIDGCVRDSAEIDVLGFPVFARGLCIRGTVKKQTGTIGQTIRCGGVTVNPGDIVLGDDDGLVLVPRDQLAAAIAAADKRVATEAAAMEKLRTGITTMDLFGLKLPGA